MLSLTAVERALWITLLALGSGSQEEGVIKHIEEWKILTLTGISPNDEQYEKNKGFLKKFEELEMIKIEKNSITLLNYKKRQEFDTTNATRQARHRAKNKNSNGIVTEKVTHKITGTDKNRIDKKRKDDRGVYPPYKSPLTPPSSASGTKSPYQKGVEFIREIKKNVKSNLQEEKTKEEKEIFNNPVDQEWFKRSKLLEETLLRTTYVALAIFLFLLSARSSLAAALRVTYRLSSPLIRSYTSSSPTPRDRANNKGEAVTPDDLETKILKTFGLSGPTMLSIARCESGLRESAIGDGHISFRQDGIEYGKSYGLFQIRCL